MAIDGQHGVSAWFRIAGMKVRSGFGQAVDTGGLCRNGFSGTRKRRAFFRPGTATARPAPRSSWQATRPAGTAAAFGGRPAPDGKCPARNAGSSAPNDGCSARNGICPARNYGCTTPNAGCPAGSGIYAARFAGSFARNGICPARNGKSIARQHFGRFFTFFPVSLNQRGFPANQPSNRRNKT